jgi:hypothetical protein
MSSRSFVADHGHGVRRRNSRSELADVGPVESATSRLSLIGRSSWEDGPFHGYTSAMDPARAYRVDEVDRPRLKRALVDASARSKMQLIVRDVPRWRRRTDALPLRMRRAV